MRVGVSAVAELSRPPGRERRDSMPPSTRRPPAAPSRRSQRPPAAPSRRSQRPPPASPGPSPGAGGLMAGKPANGRRLRRRSAAPPPPARTDSAAPGPALPGFPPLRAAAPHRLRGALPQPGAAPESAGLTPVCRDRQPGASACPPGGTEGGPQPPPALVWLFEWQPRRDGTRGNDCNLKEGRLGLGIRKMCFTVRVVRQWSRLPREVVDAQSLKDT